MKLLSIFVLGVGILVGALILNYIASQFGLLSWFDFVKDPKRANLASYLWLFIVYPLGLGFVAYLVNRFTNL